MFRARPVGAEKMWVRLKHITSYLEAKCGDKIHSKGIFEEHRFAWRWTFEEDDSVGKRPYMPEVT